MPFCVPPASPAPLVSLMPNNSRAACVVFTVCLFPSASVISYWAKFSSLVSSITLILAPVAMNAGRGKQHHQSISDHVVSVDVVRNGQVITLSKKKCEFSYRNSVLKNNSDIILGVICIWIALFLYAYYAALVVMIPVVLSLYAVILGILSLLKYIDKKGKYYLVVSLFSFAIGIIMLIKPYFTIDIYLKILGIYLIISSSYYIEEVFKPRKK